MNSNPEYQLNELPNSAIDLLGKYRKFWFERVESLKNNLHFEDYESIVLSAYNSIGLSAPLVVQVESPFQLMMLPALVRIKALTNKPTWKFIRDNATLPLWKRSIEFVDEQFTDEVLEHLGQLQSTWSKYPVLSIFARPRGPSHDSRQGFYQSILTSFEAEMQSKVAPPISEWIERETFWLEGALHSDRQSAVNIQLEAEMSRHNQLKIAIQNYTNIGTTQRAALPIFNRLGDGTGIVPEPLIREGELETQFKQQFGEKLFRVLERTIGTEDHPENEAFAKEMMHMLTGTSSDEWLTGQLSVGFNSTLFYPTLDGLPKYAFLIDAGLGHHLTEKRQTILNMRKLIANRTPICAFAEIAFICKEPLICSINEEGRFHSDDGPALEYEDGFKLFSLNGVTVSEKTVIAPHTLSVEEIDAEINLEIRRVMMERFGIGRYVLDSNAQVVSEDEVGILYRKLMTGDEPISLVRVKNSTPEPDGSIREYFLRVPPWVTTPKEAVAWTFDLEENEYAPEVES
ncbi:MAG: hypothetical protein IAF58_07120 [Leptolyngbya sp.]|nr:hypothetical protein [Candidatus Melainabacteria bacterium]